MLKRTFAVCALAFAFSNAFASDLSFGPSNAPVIVKDAPQVKAEELAANPDAPAKAGRIPFGQRIAQFAGKAETLVETSLSLIGIKYKWGGNNEAEGFDCSGFVKKVYESSIGLSLPRTALEMSRRGETIKKADLKPGDLVFFNTMRRTFSHVGIYLGSNRFIHAPRTGTTIRVDNMDSAYWEQRFTGARRLANLSEDEDSEILNMYAESPMQLR